MGRKNKNANTTAQDETAEQFQDDVQEDEIKKEVVPDQKTPVKAAPEEKKEEVKAYERPSIKKEQQSNSNGDRSSKIQQSPNDVSFKSFDLNMEIATKVKQAIGREQKIRVKI